MKNRLFLSIVSLPGILSVLLFGLHLSAFSQTQGSFTDDYSRPQVWEEVYQVPMYNGSLLYSSGDVHIENGAVQFDDCGGRSDKRVYRKLGTPLDDTWKMEGKFTPTAGGAHGVGHAIVAVTAGVTSPHQLVPDTVTSQYPTFAETNQDGIFVEYLSPLNGAPSTYYLRLRAKDGTTYSLAASTISLGLNSTYYFRLERTSISNVTLGVYSNAARTTHLTGSPISLSLSSQTITGLNVIHHGNMPSASYARELTATLDDLWVYDGSLPVAAATLETLSLSDENRVVSTTLRVPVSTPAEIANLTQTREKWTEVAYFDGLGRPRESVSVQAAPDGQSDFIAYQHYDAFGRTDSTDLPYADNTYNPGSYRFDTGGKIPVNQQRSFYNANFPHIPGTDRAKPFAVTQFEPSPLNRVVEQGAPGLDWQPAANTPGTQSSGEHTGVTKYLVNHGTEKGFRPGDGPGAMPYTYPAGELQRVIVWDENVAKSETTTDKLGRTIYTKTYASATDSALTQYVYDLFGRVKYVIQPEGWEIARTSGLTSTVLDHYAFQYVYDARGRVIEKKVPGAEVVYLVYDPLDRVVLTQDGRQRNLATKEWLFTKYDDLNRPIVTGVYASNATRSVLQDTLNLRPDFSESRSGASYGALHGYTHTAFPNLTASGVTVHSVTYYDDYDFDRTGTPDATYLPDAENFPEHSPSGLLRGRVTAVKVRVLEKDTDMPDWLWTITFYDKYGREIQTQADNHLKGKDITWQEYNFAGELLLSKHAHTGYYFDQPPGPDFEPYERSATIYKSYTYDARGRLLRIEQKTEDPDNPGHETEYTTLSEHRYDVLGQMTGKNLGYEWGSQFLQIGDYQYNIRGWLSKFNQPSTATPSGTYRDLLAFELHYNTGASSIVSGTQNLFNGNIAAMQWQVLGEGKEIRAFAFTYDPMNRLTSAKYREKTSSSWNVNSGRYDVTNLVYDRNGNIKSLQRKGMTNPLTDPPGYGVMDNLSYTYENSGKSNRLQRINDAGVKTVMTGVEHFVDGNTSNTDYLYDNSGNLKQDLNKGISSIVYNHLNKPTLVTFSNGKKIQYIYDAAGQKLRQKVFGNGGSSTTIETDYVGPFHYEDADGDGSSATTAIQFFAHEEGRVRRAGSELVYEWFLKDHLGNVRVMFADMDGNGAVSPDPVNGEVLQVDHYYPFGLRMAGLSLVPGVKNSYLFTGKEVQDELGLGWIDFGARMYDAASSRWNGVDVQAERYLFLSTFAYVANNPVMLVDPNGEEIWDAHGRLVNVTEDEDGNLSFSIDDGDIDEGTLMILQTLASVKGGVSHIQKLAGDQNVYQLSLHEETGISITKDKAGNFNLAEAANAFTTEGRGRNSKNEKTTIFGIHIFKGSFDYSTNSDPEKVFSVFMLNGKGSDLRPGSGNKKFERGQWVQLSDEDISSIYQQGYSSLLGNTGNEFRNENSTNSNRQQVINGAKKKSWGIFLIMTSYHESELHGYRGIGNEGHGAFVADEYQFLIQNFPEFDEK